MDNLISASEAARRLNIPQPTMSRWLREGRVPGAMKVSNMWLIPATVTMDEIDTPVMGRPLKNGNNGETALQEG